MKFINIFWFILISFVLFNLYAFFAKYAEFNHELDKLEAKLKNKQVIMLELEKDGTENQADNELIYKILNVPKNQKIHIYRN